MMPSLKLYLPSVLSPAILTLLALSVLTEAYQLAESDAATCGTCRCIPSGENPLEGDCPWAEGSGRHYKFKPALIDLYKSFSLNQQGLTTQPFLKNEAGVVGACFAFGKEAKALLGLTGMPDCDTSAFASLTQTTVCGYVFDSNPSDGVCAGKTYRMETFPDPQSAMTAGAMISHFGGCGVCSNAQDTATLLDHTGDLDEKSYLCGVDFNLDRQAGVEPTETLANLINCVQQIGFTPMCANVRSQHLLVSGGACKVPCAADQPWVNTPNNPTTCAKNPCISCTETPAILNGFRAFAGREPTISGIITNAAQPCDTFPEVNLDPCPGSGALDDTSYAPSPPTNLQAPSSSGFASFHSGGAMAVAALLTIGAVLDSL